MRKIALAAAICLATAAVAGAGSDNQKSENSDRAKFDWKVYNARGKIVQEKTGTKTFRRRGDWLYNGTHRAQYSWKLRYGVLHVDHHYYGNRWTLWYAGDRAYVGQYTGKKKGKRGWTCRMTPTSDKEWTAWLSIARENRSRPTESASYVDAESKTKYRSNTPSNTHTAQSKKKVAYRIVNIRNRGKVLRGRWMDPRRTRGRWVQVTLQVQNKTNKPLMHVPFHLVDKQGRVYSRLPMGPMYIRAPQPMEYQPGVPTHRTLVFAIAPGAQPDHVILRGTTL